MVERRLSCDLRTRSLLLLPVFLTPAVDAGLHDWDTTARRHGIEPMVLYAAGLLASGRTENGQVSAWPWTLDLDGRRVHYATQDQAAKALAGTPRKADQKHLGVGVMGIPILKDDPSELLDPRRNLERGAAMIARGMRAHPGDEALAIGRYRYASDADARAFGKRVLALAKELKVQGQASSSTGRIRTVAAFSGGRLSACLPNAKRDVAAAVEAAARRHGVDPSFALAIAKRESAFRQTAVSPKGARGVMQLMPGTARRYGADARDLNENIDAGVRYLRDLAHLFDGDPMLVAAGYNAGEGAVIKHGYRIPPYRETQQYVPLVLAARGELNACRSN
jgi:soluble lytic murein transglycosylase-like protein